MDVIIGAGPAGLSAAYHLRSEYLILEKEASAGGLCRSFELGGTSFDLGGHAFFTKHAYVGDLVDRLCSGEIYRQQRRAWVWSHGTYVRYPFQTHLHGLPIEVVEECLLGLLSRIGGADSQDRPNNLDEWIQRTFGDGIRKHFLGPYNEKLWAFPLSEVSPDWCSDRIVTPDPAPVVSGALRGVEFTNFPNTLVKYPARGGFFGLYAGLLSAVQPNLRRGSAQSIDLRRRCLTTDDGKEIRYDWLISTMPLTELVNMASDIPQDCRDAAARLRHNSLCLVNLVFDRHLTDMQRVYVAHPEVPFHKLVMNSNSSPDLRGRPTFGVQAEVSWSRYKPIERSNLKEQVFQCLREMELARSTDRVVASSLVDVPYAYPVYTSETQAARRHLLETLEKYRVLCAGRFGEWLYINSDDAVMRGKERADMINRARDAR